MKKAIIDTKVVSSHGNQIGAQNYISTDKLYLLSTIEVWGDDPGYDSASVSTKQLDYYENNGVTLLENLEKVLEKWNNSTTWWWLRSSYSSSNDTFYHVNISGTSGANRSYYAFCVAPAFRVG